EKAINMSTYAWVEWTAPILEGTIYSQLPPDEELGILFEYGAESGVLQPPWSLYAMTHGDPPFAPSKNEVSSERARTGSKSMYFYQVPPSKTGDQRHPGVRYYDMQEKEFYLSWWTYFDGRWLVNDVDGWGTTLGGWQIFFGPSAESPGGKWRWWTGGRFYIHQTSRYVSFGYGWGKHSDALDYSPDAEAIEQTWQSNYRVTDYLNQWVHFQLYIKFEADNTGIVRAWFNDDLFAEKTNIKTDPSSYAEWSQYNCVWAVSEYPFIVVELYQSTESFESWMWVDDVVAATEKVTESYGVLDK
ncbi:MAG: polysaccharide lyase, partial [Candidatus Bathyarchaeota archaeon]|nr:polysaccharide lyase [Candidatus Bathyarchaeota archaeon]